MVLLMILEIILLTVVVIWMIATTLLYQSLHKSFLALKNMETGVAECHKDCIGAMNEQLAIFADVLQEQNDICSDCVDVMNKYKETAEENKQFAFKTVFRAQDLLKTTKALIDNIEKHSTSDVAYPDPDVADNVAPVGEN